MKTGYLVFLLPVLTVGDPSRIAKKGFREKIRCIDNGKFYRNPNTPRDLAFRKVNLQNFSILILVVCIYQILIYRKSVQNTIYVLRARYFHLNAALG